MTLAVDKSAWNRLAFGDAVRNVNETVRAPETAGIDRIIAMEHLDPGEMIIERWGATADGTTFTRRVKPGQTLFGKRRAYQRKVAYAEFDAICSGDIYTFEADETQMLGEFLPFLVQSDEFFDHALGTSAGSLSPRTNWRDLANFKLDLPPLDVQKRIADLLWGIERHRRALAATVAQAQAAFAQVVTRRLAALPTTTKLGELTTTRSGPSFAASDVHELPVEGSVPVMGIPNTKPNGVIDLEGVGYVTGLPRTVGRVDESSLILIRTNGNRQRIGNVYLPPVEANGYAVSAFQFLMHVNSPSDRTLLFWILSEEGMQRRMSDGASGTVGLGNLAVRWLNEQVIPWAPDQRARDEAVEEFEGHAAAVEAIRNELNTSTALKKAVLTEVFGGN